MDNNFLRYSRQIFIDEVGVQGQRKLKNARVLVIGTGGLGSPVLQYLAASGIGKLGFADFDKVELHNLNRQVIHSENNIGKAKVDSAAEFLRSLNSTITIEPLNRKVDDGNLDETIAGYDIIVDGSDNFHTRYLINDSCVRNNKTIVYGSIYRFEGQVAVFNHNGSKNLRDLFPEMPDPQDMPNCDSNGVLGPLAGMVGTIMAMQTVKIIIGLTINLNQLMIIDSLNWNLTKVDY